MEKILVIDGSPVQADLLRAILKDNYDVTTAYTAESGLAQAVSGSYSLILLDAIMPSIKGLEMLAQLKGRAATRHIPVILITSLSDFRSEEEGLRLGAVECVSEPFHPLVVKARVDTQVRLHHYRTQVQQQAPLDQLTGVFNRRHYDAASKEKWQDAVRLGVPISICMLDIDRFKAYNDAFGHPAGDEAIASVATAISARFRRTTDLFARYDGEKFVAVFLGSSSLEAFTHLKRVRQEVEELHIPQKQEVSPWVTVSVGGVTLTSVPGDTYGTYQKIADTMLHNAKRFGRNQVVWYSDSLEVWRENK